MVRYFIFTPWILKFFTEKIFSKSENLFFILLKNTLYSLGFKITLEFD